ncbi:MAG: metal ABC transporter ATP-binding protein [Anaerolineaceae bacterium]|nr:metal ABC transporter ATP-binding protein [Anaerolineaceae bacterium]
MAVKTEVANGKVQSNMPPAEAVLTVNGLKVIYDGEPAVEEINFTIYAGERVAVIGPNGAGKSTLIKAIMGLLQPQAGRIDVDPARLGYVPQHEGVDWDFPVTVRDVVMMGRIKQIGWLRLPGMAHWRTVEAALERVGMADLAGRQIGDLSGGQRRRAFIARALAQQADTLVLDEPFSGVDAHAQSSLMDVLESLNQEGMTIILSTHDLGLAFSRFDRVLAINTTLIADGEAKAVYTPEVLGQLYGGQLATWDNGRQVMVFVDDHHCEEC